MVTCGHLLAIVGARALRSRVSVAWRVLRSRIAAAWRGVGPMRSTGGPCAPVYRLFSPPRVEGAGGLAGWSVTKPPVRPDNMVLLVITKSKGVLSHDNANKCR